jgi:Cytochrome P450
VDFISRLLVSELDGAPIPRDDIITICYTAMLAGLDTTSSALGFIFHHLAGDTELRHRLTARPELWPRAAEEFIRLYPLVFMDGRLVTRDIDFHGLHMRKGEIAWLGLASANHDPKKFADPRSFDIDRADLNHHLAFGAGPYRCMGMHLARHELVVDRPVAAPVGGLMGIVLAADIDLYNARAVRTRYKIPSRVARLSPRIAASSSGGRPSARMAAISAAGSVIGQSDP